MDVARLLPHFVNNSIAEQFVTNDMDGFPQEHGEAFKNYFFAAYLLEVGSDAEKGLTSSFHYGAYAKHPLTTRDRLGNPDLPFPIAFAYGDEDWLGSEGADRICRSNKFYDEGLSQIFVVPQSDHVTYMNNPDALLEFIIGFFNRTLKNSLAHKPRTKTKVITRQPSMKNCVKDSILPPESIIKHAEAELHEDGEWEHLDMSPNDRIPQTPGYFTSLQEAIIEYKIEKEEMELRNQN